MDDALPVRIRADDRERRSALLRVLEENQDTEVRIERLVVGDYEVNGQLLIERKTLPDLVVSIKEGRLFAQLYCLMQASLPSALLLEGTTADLAGCEKEHRTKDLVGRGGRNRPLRRPSLEPTGSDTDCYSPAARTRSGS